MKEVEYLSYPQLKEPVLIAAWPGMGGIASICVEYLKEELKAIEFARLNMKECFELSGALVEDNIIQPFIFPQNTFFYWQNPQGGRDLILFEGGAQPSFKNYELGQKVLQVAEGLGVDLIITIAAALVSEQPVKPMVWATATSPLLCQELKKYGAILKGNFFIAGMNGGLLTIAQERGLKAICLLGETLRDFPQRRDYLAALSIFQVLVKYLDLPVNLTRLRRQAKKSQQELEEMIMRSRREFIDRFTFPLWEREKEEDS